MSLSFRNYCNIRRARPAWIILCLAPLCADSAWGAWSVAPRVESGLLFETNPRNRSESQEEESALGLSIDAQLDMSVYNEKTSASLTPRGLWRFYRKETNEDLEDQNYNVDGNIDHQMQRARIGVNGGYRDASLRLLEFDIDESTGLPFITRTSQLRKTAGAYWSYQLTTLNTLSLNANHAKVEYDPPTVRRFDYDTSLVSASFSHALSRKNALSFRANLSKFDGKQNFQGVKNDSKTNGASVIYTSQMSDTLNGVINLGWARTKADVTATQPPLGPSIFKSETDNFVGNISLTKRSETMNYNFSVGQTITPNSLGSEVVRRNVKFSIGRQFTRNFSANAVVDLSEQKSTLEVSLQKREFMRLGASAEWQLARDWFLNTRYRFFYNRTKNTLTDSLFASQNHTLFLGLTYKGVGWR